MSILTVRLINDTFLRTFFILKSHLKCENKKKTRNVFDTITLVLFFKFFCFSIQFLTLFNLFYIVLNVLCES